MIASPKLVLDHEAESQLGPYHVALQLAGHRAIEVQRLRTAEALRPFM